MGRVCRRQETGEEESFPIGSFMRLDVTKINYVFHAGPWKFIAVKAFPDSPCASSRHFNSVPQSPYSSRAEEWGFLSLDPAGFPTLYSSSSDQCSSVVTSEFRISSMTK